MSTMSVTASRPWLSPAARSRWALFGGLAALIVIVADQLTKLWVAANFPETSCEHPGRDAGRSDRGAR